MQPRHLGPRVREALADRPVVALVGPRQAGKSTLALDLVDKGLLERYVTLDDAVVLAAARGDPAGFVAGLPHGSVIDEVQRAPELYLAIKARVDRDRRPGPSSSRALRTSWSCRRSPTRWSGVPRS